MSNYTSLQQFLSSSSSRKSTKVDPLSVYTPLRDESTVVVVAPEKEPPEYHPNLKMPEHYPVNIKFAGSDDPRYHEDPKKGGEYIFNSKYHPVAPRKGKTCGYVPKRWIETNGLLEDEDILNVPNISDSEANVIAPTLIKRGVILGYCNGANDVGACDDCILRGVLASCKKVEWK